MPDKKGGARKAHILVVDDEQGVAELIMARLEPLATKISWFRSGVEALEFLKSASPGLMILDYSLPDKNAEELLEAAAALKLTVPPFIVATGRGDEATAVAMMKKGASDYVVKDIDFLNKLFVAAGYALRLAEAERKQTLAEVSYRTLAENTPDLLARFDRGLRHVYVNRAAAQAGSLPVAGYAGKTILETGVPAPLAELWESRLKKVFETGLAAEYEDSSPAAGGDRFYSTKLQPEFSASGEVVTVLSLACDITERKLAEEVLKKSEEKYKSLVETTATGFLILDAEGKVLDANAEYVRLTGHADLAEIRGKRVLEWTAAHDLERYNREVAKCLERGFVRDLCMDYSGPQGINPVEINATVIKAGNSVHILSLVRDVSKLKQAEYELREDYEMQGLLNLLLRRSLDGGQLAARLSDSLASILSVSWLSVEPRGAVFLLQGKTLKMVAQHGLTPATLANCAEMPLGRCICGGAALTGKVVVTSRLDSNHEIKPEGMTEHGHYCAPILAGARTLGVLNLYLKADTTLTPRQEKFVAAATDILAANILHSQMESQLVQSQKMESVGRLAGGVAHDFNNILTAIKFYSAIIHKDLEPGDPKRADAGEILIAADRAVALTRQLLAFSRRQIMAPKVVDLNAVTGGILNMLGRVIGEHIKLKTKLAPEACLVKVDPGQLEQVIMNLVLNSRDAMPKGGVVTLETMTLCGTEAFYAAHPDLKRGALACLKISDTGSGMTPEVLSHAFEPFFTTKEQGKGTGLGLSTVFGIVKQSGGEIEVESEPGKGASFRIYLPLEDALPPAGEKAGAGEKGAAPKCCETILLVEDEESLRRLEQRVLTAAGYKVLSAADGQAALKVLEEYGGPVDLLLTDVVMPGMSGRDLAREMAGRKLTRRTLFMSGYTDDAIVKHGVLEPGLAFIYKPFAIDTLTAKLREVLDGPEDQAKA